MVPDVDLVRLSLHPPLDQAEFLEAEAARAGCTVDEVIQRLITSAQQHAARSKRTLSGKPFNPEKARQAIRRIRDLGERNSLGGLSIEDLLDEGRER